MALLTIVITSLSASGFLALVIIYKFGKLVKVKQEHDLESSASFQRVMPQKEMIWIVRSLTAAIPNITQPVLAIKEIAFSTIISQHTKFEYCVFSVFKGVLFLCRRECAQSQHQFVLYHRSLFYIIIQSKFDLFSQDLLTFGPATMTYYLINSVRNRAGISIKQKREKRGKKDRLESCKLNPSNILVSSRIYKQSLADE